MQDYVLFLIVVAALIVIGILAGIYVYAELRASAPVWRRLPARPGLPPDMEYQCWSAMADFWPEELSDAVVMAVELLAPVYGRTHVFAALRGARILVYRKGTYPGGACGPGPNTGVVLTPRWAAVERQLENVAHSLAHLVERHVGAPDYGHATWDKRGVSAAVFTYEEKRARYADTYGA